VIKLPDLAWVLENVAERGAAGFYSGSVAERVVMGVREAGGLWTLEDFAAYRVKERAPIRTRYGDYELVTAPPPSSGGVAIAEMLNILEPYPINALEPVPRAHLIVEAMRRAFRDRAVYLGDPDFVDIARHAHQPVLRRWPARLDPPRPRHAEQHAGRQRSCPRAPTPRISRSSTPTATGGGHADGDLPFGSGFCRRAPACW
jgi:gamma-glutamyltranspeptidase